VNEFNGFRRRDPSCSETLRMDARKLQQLLQEGHPFIGHHITRLVMTFAKTSAGHKDAVRPCLQSLQDVVGRDRPGAHHPDDPDRRRILHSTDPSQVSRSISSPGTQKSNDLWSKLLCHEISSQNEKRKVQNVKLKTVFIFSLSFSICNLQFAITIRLPWPFQFGHRSVCW